MIKYRSLSRKERRLTKGRYKYELTESFITFVKIKPKKFLPVPDYISLGTDGRLAIYNRYRWDGPSFLTIDRPKKHCMEGSLVHDALYQLMREGLLDIAMRPMVDEQLRQDCLRCGMWKWRANLWHWFVSKFAGYWATPASRKG